MLLQPQLTVMLDKLSDEIDNFTRFPAHHELSTCRTSIVSPKQPV